MSSPHPQQAPAVPATDPRITDAQGRRRSRGAEAVCFTAGIDGAAFSAGVVHAYLAADRPPPSVVAGISTGALSAAAMAQSYDALARAPDGTEAQREGARWGWYRRYLELLTDRPLRVFWDGLPNFTDLSTSGGRLPPLEDPATPEGLKEDEREALRRRYLVQHLMRWLLTVPVRVSHVASLLTNGITRCERLSTIRWWDRAAAWLAWLPVTLVPALRLLQHAVFSPCFLNAARYETPPPKLPRLRPLFGWRGWLSACAVFGLVLAFVVSVLGWIAAALAGRWTGWEVHGFAGLARRGTLGGLGLIAAVSLWRWGAPRLLGWLEKTQRGNRFALGWRRGARLLKAQCFRYLSRRSGLDRSLLSDFHLRRLLLTAFDTRRSQEAEARTACVLVASPLQTLRVRKEAQETMRGRPPLGRNHQLWAQPHVAVTDALRACLALPGLFPPVRVKKADLHDNWTAPWRRLELDGVKEVDLVDAAVIRQNPVPALFSYLRSNTDGYTRGRELEQANGPEHPGIHVIYTVPVDPKDPAEPSARPPDIVEVGLNSLQLVRRCDTQLEVEQTNYESRLAALLDAPPDQAAREDPARTWRVFADEVAPDTRSPYANPVDPTREELLRAAAEGCRNTLGRLYADTLRAAGGKAHCTRLLSEVAPDRDVPWREHPGCAEVCSHCTRFVQHKQLARPPAPEVSGRFFPQLQREAPRVVLVASGGVFRGAFHIGLAGALLAVKLKPDLIVGASVGSLMGAAIGAMHRLDEKKALDRLQTLTCLFRDVDMRVAHTRLLLQASRTLVVRSLGVKLSPGEVQRMIERGAQRDAGFAAVGAPPALLDALSQVLMLPHRDTCEVASLAVSGKVAQAAHALLQLVREETLARLDIREALLGTSLLELRARELLALGPTLPETRAGWGLGQGAQPFMGRVENATHEQPEIAFFATATDLSTEGLRLLGGQVPGEQPFDLVQAALASSAFPAVFAPRPASSVFPGVGRTDVRFADGGMFDNLPFLPALGILSAAQRAEQAAMSDTEVLAHLKARQANPDLFLVGALEVAPEIQDPTPRTYEYLPEIIARAGALRANVKIRSMERSSEAVDLALLKLLDQFDKRPRELDAHTRDTLEGVVNAAVLPIFPASQEHLNPTFAFSASTGLDRERVERSIADGCFQTLLALREHGGEPAVPLTGKALAGLRAAGKLRKVEVTEAGKVPPPPACPYFLAAPAPGKEAATEPLPCPFAGTGERGAVHHACVRDPVHVARILEARRQVTPKPPPAHAGGPPGIPFIPPEAEAERVRVGVRRAGVRG